VKRHTRELSLAIAIAALAAVLAALAPGFFSLQNLRDLTMANMPVLIVALGMTLVIATRGIDISVGAVVAIAGAAAATILADAPSQVLLAVGAALAVGLAAGVWNGLLVAFVGMQPIIATLILMVAGRGAAQLLTGGQIITVYYPPYFVIGNGFVLGVPVAALIALAVWGGMALLLERSALGLFIQAIGVNPRAARVAGVRARAITVCVYAFCGLCAGIAGLIVSSNVKSADGNNAGLLIELDAILAVTLGGTLLTGGRFSLAGSIVGALIIQTLTSTIYSIGVPPETTLLFKALVVTVVCLLQSPAFRQKVFKRRRKPVLAQPRVESPQEVHA